ncbi:unnamed protein product, partial [Candidula unifasciata]
FIFWSIFQGLAPMIWFYPLNELEISGYEVFAVVWLSPIVCLIPGVLPFLQNKWVLNLLRLVTVSSLASFQAPDTLSRLTILAIGAGVSMLVLAATLWNPSKPIRYRSYWGLILGLHAFLAGRVWYMTFVPTWWDDVSNSVVIACGVISVTGFIFGDDEPQPNSSAPATKEHEPQSKPHWMPCGIGLGSILYLTHMCFGEASLVTRWTVKSFPDPGPVPLLWGSLVLLSLAIGSFSFWATRQKYHILCVLAASAALSGLYWLGNPYLAFFAGCCLAFLTMSLWPVVVEIVTRSSPALCLTVAGATYIFQCLFWVWTVAFNFVPYGVYTREHTDWLIGIVMGGILLLVLLYSPEKRRFTVSFETPQLSLPTSGMYFKVLVMIFLVGQAGMLNRYHRYAPGARQEKFDPKVFTAGIWTFHFGYDNKGWPSMERAVSTINDTGVDVLTLLETDASKPFLGNNDLATWLAEKLNFYVDFGPSTKDHTWGNLILSRYPIVKSVHHLLPSPHGELAPAITASINISGSIVDFVVTHMGNDRDVLDRRLQAQFLAKELKLSPNPAVFLGYVTSAPGSENYYHLLTEGQVRDIDPTDSDRWCEYIMYKKLIRLGYARISHGGLSDTEVQLATFRIPPEPDHFRDNKKTTILPEKHGIDTNILFNKRFGTYYSGHGFFEGHGFHMDTPKYFYSENKKGNP